MGRPVNHEQYKEYEDNIFISPNVDEATARMVKDKLTQLGKLAPDEVKATYKLEVMFGTEHSVTKTTYGVLTIWSNGAHIRGGGDGAIYVCPGKLLKVNTCNELIPEVSLGLSRVLCPSCKMLWKAEEIVGEHFYRLPIEKWADVILYWFMKTGMNADLKIKYSYKYKNMDIRQATHEEAERKLRGEFLNKVRDANRRKARIYPLRNIIKDTSAGADLYNRILSFVRS